MADYPILTSPDGSTSINIGSVMLADGVDYGMAPMFANSMGGNPLADGGQLGARWSAPRMFKFPIRLATVGALTPAGVARALRNMAQSGAWVDLMLSGVATANAVRFDVIDGRVRETQDVKMWAGAGRREGVLELDVQPYGYWPTWITLASSASVGIPGTLAIPGASILGDVPGLAQIMVMSALPSQQLGVGATYGFDAFFYSMGNKAPAWITAASMIGITGGNGVAASLVGDAAAPASQLQRIFLSPSAAVIYGLQLGYQPFVAADLNPSYFGRYRLHAFARLISPSYGGAIPLTAEIAMSGPGAPTWLASGGLVASVGQPLTLASDGAYVPIPTGFGFFPLGDINIPTTPAGLNVSAGHRVKIWGNVPSHGVGTVSLDIAGLWLQSLDAGHGIITRDLQNPAAGAAASYYGMYPFAIDSYQRDVQAGQGPSAFTPSQLPVLWMASTVPAFSLLDRYRGVFPQVSPSTLSIEIMLGARRLPVAYRNEVLADTPKIWWRFNEASGIATVLDWSGNGFHGAASNMILGASSLIYGEPGGATGATQFAQSASNAAIPAANAPRTIEAWYSPATEGVLTNTVAQLGNTNTGQMAIYFNPSTILLTLAGTPSYAFRWRAGQTYHIAAAYNGTFVQLYVNGQAIGATNTFAAALNTAPVFQVGNLSTGGAFAGGGIDEAAVYPSALSAARILAHYLAGRSAMGATSPPVYQQGGIAGVSVRYQPRFAFQKDI